MVLFCKDVPVLSFIDDKIIIHKPELLPLEIADESENIDIYGYIRHRPCHILSEQNKQLLSNKYPEDFYIDKYKMDENHWTDGFINFNKARIDIPEDN